MRSIPGAEEVISSQLNAYNRKDIDEFMRWWADDCHYLAFPNDTLCVGRADIRKRHIERFLEPDLHGELLSRIVMGNTVVDHELVTRNFPEGKGQVEVICIYEVQDGKIAKAWFKMGERRLF
ncbi:nuclear transport factor 2 family protein [Rhizobium lemnae]|uniref:Nuclear transport factor 2 family protein n=1 Tax=Rhizobium lemnae TaxID=1214924 RepID=A0ABV8E830_9HYPH|nr:nuclear transport factor 2 family protein [Rhizobium lemnae]MCJ8509350.1 nuclear transport factor 2 family protein [Rhizobium lemnae]